MQEDVAKRPYQSELIRSNQNRDGTLDLSVYLWVKDRFDALNLGDSETSAQVRVSKSRKKKLDFQNWTLRKNIGRGAYGKVFLVTHTYINRDNMTIHKNYAMKVYNKDNLVNHNLAE